MTVPMDGKASVAAAERERAALCLSTVRAVRFRAEVSFRINDAKDSDAL